jgi:nucleotide-binding universal stress UspA family protein
MTCLIAVDRGSVERLYRAATRVRKCEEICLVHVITSGRAAEVEAGQRVLREAARGLHRLESRLRIEAQLEVGGVAGQITQVADERGARLIVMAAYGEDDFPYLAGRGRAAQAVLARTRQPLLLVGPTGAKLHRPRRSSRRRRVVASPPRQSVLAWGRSPLQTTVAPL